MGDVAVLRVQDEGGEAVCERVEYSGERGRPQGNRWAAAEPVHQAFFFFWPSAGSQLCQGRTLARFAQASQLAVERAQGALAHLVQLASAAVPELHSGFGHWFPSGVHSLSPQCTVAWR